MLEKVLNLPTPFQIVSDPVSLIVIAIFLCFIIVEELFPGRPLPRIRYWKIKGICVFIIYFFKDVSVELNIISNAKKKKSFSKFTRVKLRRA